MTTKNLKKSLAEKLHPSNCNCSPKMAFIFGLILGQDWANIRGISCVNSEMTITSDGFILVNGCFVGDYSDLIRNINLFMEDCSITKKEKQLFWELFSTKITDYRLKYNGPAIS